jgi:hypothetical protein
MAQKPQKKKKKDCISQSMALNGFNKYFLNEQVKEVNFNRLVEYKMLKSKS